MKINLGCGRDYRSGFINIDIDRGCNPDVVMDLDKGIDLPDDSVKLIHAFSVLEHVNHYDFILREAHRVCMNRALVKIIVPHFAAPCAFFDDHKRFFSTRSFRKYTPKDKDSVKCGYSETPLFKITKKIITFPRGINPLNYIAPLFNLSNNLQLLFENTILKNIFVPEMMYFELKVIKNV